MLTFVERIRDASRYQVVKDIYDTDYFGELALNEDNVVN